MFENKYTLTVATLLMLFRILVPTYSSTVRKKIGPQCVRVATAFLFAFGNGNTVLFSMLSLFREKVVVRPTGSYHQVCLGAHTLGLLVERQPFLN